MGSSLNVSPKQSFVFLDGVSASPGSVSCRSLYKHEAPTLNSASLFIQCRWDNSLLWDPPTESSFMGQIISSGLHHFRLFFLHTKVGKDISGTANLDFQK